MTRSMHCRARVRRRQGPRPAFGQDHFVTLLAEDMAAQVADHGLVIHQQDRSAAAFGRRRDGPHVAEAGAADGERGR